MRIRVIVLSALLAVPGTLPAHAERSKAKCEETKRQIRKIESKMRQGYSASEGIRLEDRLRRLRDLRAKRCR